MGNRISWDELRIGYNRMKNTNYATVASFMTAVLKENTYEETADILGISTDTITRKRRAFLKIGVDIRNYKPIREKFENIPAKRMVLMTKREISEEINCSLKYVEIMARRCNREFIRVRNGGIYYANQKRRHIVHEV